MLLNLLTDRSQNTDMILSQFPPMGVYETLFKFADATGKYMGDPGTHTWAQGYPLTTQIPGGPDLPRVLSKNETEPGPTSAKVRSTLSTISWVLVPEVIWANDSVGMSRRNWWKNCPL